jgi:serine/threonine protein kinase
MILIDFGTAGSSEKTSGGEGTPGYTDPFIRVGTRTPSFEDLVRADIFSIGCILFVLWYSKPFFEVGSPDERSYVQNAGLYVTAKLQKCPPALLPFLTNMLGPPEKREPLQKIMLRLVQLLRKTAGALNADSRVPDMRIAAASAAPEGGNVPFIPAEVCEEWLVSTTRDFSSNEK